MWTGFYAGLNAGYNFGTGNNTQSIAIGQHAFTGYGYDYYNPWGAVGTLGAGLALSGVGGGNNANQNGFIGGGQVGYNYQWGQSFVIGLEADIQGTGIRGTSTTAGIGGDTVQSYHSGYYDDYVNSTATGLTRVNAGVDWMGTVRGRIGWLFTPTMLVYGTGGLTYGGVYANVNNVAVSSSSEAYFYKGVQYNQSYSDVYNHTFVGGGNKSQTLVGWNVGGGLEWMFMPNWSLKAEAIYWNMGNMTLPTVALAAAPYDYPHSSGDSSWYSSGATAIGATRVNYQGVIARAGVNYHFNWGSAAPIVAKY
jgi:outer membrane immunogenic protein